jgi:uncharacterized protein (DUF486 family)
MQTIILLTISNIFMTFAWDGHLDGTEPVPPRETIPMGMFFDRQFGIMVR